MPVVYTKLLKSSFSLALSPSVTSRVVMPRFKKGGKGGKRLTWLSQGLLVPVLILTYESFIVFSLPCPAEEGSDRAALDQPTTALKPTQLLTSITLK